TYNWPPAAAVMASARSSPMPPAAAGGLSRFWLPPVAHSHIPPDGCSSSAATKTSSPPGLPTNVVLGGAVGDTAKLAVPLNPPATYTRPLAALTELTSELPA